MLGVAIKQPTESVDSARSRTDLAAAKTDFRQKVQTLYQEGSAQIDSVLDVIIAHLQIARSGESGSRDDIQKLLEAAVALYMSKCGPLDRSGAATLMLKAINRCLK
jgi:hypothetical protein